MEAGFALAQVVGAEGGVAGKMQGDRSVLRGVDGEVAAVGVEDARVVGPEVRSAALAGEAQQVAGQSADEAFCAAARV